MVAKKTTLIEYADQRTIMMNKRNKTMRCIIYPESSWKVYWDLFVSFLLVYSCFVIPLQLCFDIENVGFLVINNMIDILFFADIIVIFCTAITTDEFETIDDHKEIALQYVQGWFPVDLLAILPLDLILAIAGSNKSGDDISQGGGKVNSVIRIMRLGRLSKLIKLMKLLRFLKFLNKQK